MKGRKKDVVMWISKKPLCKPPALPLLILKMRWKSEENFWRNPGGPWNNPILKKWFPGPGDPNYSISTSASGPCEVILGPWIPSHVTSSAIWKIGTLSSGIPVIWGPGISPSEKWSLFWEQYSQLSDDKCLSCLPLMHTFSGSFQKLLRIFPYLNFAFNMSSKERETRKIDLGKRQRVLCSQLLK